MESVRLAAFTRPSTAAGSSRCRIVTESTFQRANEKLLVLSTTAASTGVGNAASTTFPAAAMASAAICSARCGNRRTSGAVSIAPMSAPIGSPSSIHGTYAIAVSPATSTASWVIAVASKGSAT
jgi:hypothetical protein